MEMLGLLQRRPQRVVPGVVIVGKAQLGRVIGQLHGPGSEGGEPLHLGDGMVDVDDGDLVGHHQTLRIHRGEVGEVIVERPGHVPPSVLDQVEMAERAEFGVQDLHVHLITVHVLQPSLGIEIAGAPGALQVEGLQRHHLPAPHLLVRHGLGGERVVVVGDEPLGQTGPDIVGLHQYM